MRTNEQNGVAYEPISSFSGWFQVPCENSILRKCDGVVH